MTGVPTRLRLTTAGVSVGVEDRTGRHLAALARAAGVGTDGPGDLPAADEVRVVLERERRPFDTTGMAPVTRGVWSDGATVVLDSVGGSGFAQAWRVGPDGLTVRARWTPGAVERAASGARARFDALRAQVLLHYPALWWAGTRGRTPLHASVLELDGVGVLLAGPGGVGKSTLVAGALADGARATCDNVAAADGDTAAGLREPLRLHDTAGTDRSGARTTHGRREQAWTGQVPALRPDLVVVVRRGSGPRTSPVDAATAHRALVAGTYAAGELRRFWPLTAVLGLATGLGPVHPPVEEVARRLTERCRCVDLELGAVAGAPLRALLADQLTALTAPSSEGASR